MKISERVALIKAGYSKDEIAQLVAEEKALATVDVPEVKEPDIIPDEDPNKPELPTDMFPDWAKAFIAEVKELRTEMQQNALRDIEQPEAQSIDDVANDALKSYLGGK